MHIIELKIEKYQHFFIYVNTKHLQNYKFIFTVGHFYFTSEKQQQIQVYKKKQVYRKVQ